jgi:hypothetical protein
MKMPAAEMSVIAWSQVETSEHPGAPGMARWKTRNFGEVRLRMVEYSVGYVADHWCSKGHVILCLSGTLHIELQDGQRHTLEAGQTYHVGDGSPAHRTSAAAGAQLFIVD